MAQTTLSELTYNGQKTVVEVARRDAKGRTIDTTYVANSAIISSSWAVTGLWSFGNALGIITNNINPQKNATGSLGSPSKSFQYCYADYITAKSLYVDHIEGTNRDPVSNANIHTIDCNNISGVTANFTNVYHGSGTTYPYVYTYSRSIGDISANHYVILSNGLILAWGRVTHSGATSFTVTLPITFRRLHAIFLTENTYGGSKDGQWFDSLKSQDVSSGGKDNVSSFTIQQGTSENTSCYYLAIGYKNV